MWKEIIGFDNYFISTDGRVMSKRRKNPIIMKPKKNQKGYLYVGLSLGKSQTVKKSYLHHLVYEAYIGERTKGLVIDHRDRDNTNNSVYNLRQITHSENSFNRKNKSSKYRGVYFCKTTSLWRARLKDKNGKWQHLASCFSEEEAYSKILESSD
jgi:hypothetical protein